jgi:cysteinyl-tRNA synthetase
MSKPIEKLKKQLIEISEVVNAFKSEAVQVQVVSKLLDAMIEFEKGEIEGHDHVVKKPTKLKGSIPGDQRGLETNRKKPGATKVLNQLLSTDFFKKPHSISSIAEYCKEQFNSDFKTSELSGILLKLANENKLTRQRNDENNRFEYVEV